ncbi:MAG: PAS domain S-box protein [Desulfobulbaceae bacterium]|nr:PAS domain S-box protein [Desulfobulbaceae bacterium]
MGDKPTYEELQRRVEELEFSEVKYKQEIQSLRGAVAESQRFRSALDEVSAYIYMKDTQSRYVYANRLTLELFGCSLEELVGRDDTNFFPPDTVKRLREVDLRVFAGEQTFEEIDVAGSERRIYLETKTPIYEEPERTTIRGLLGVSMDITDRKQADEKLNKITYELGERLKELNCLYAISKLVEEHTTTEDIIPGIVDLIPISWQYPEITCAQIILNGKTYKTDNFQETEWLLSQRIIVSEMKAGVIEVYYFEEKPEVYEGPFLREERALINAIAERLGHIIERKQAEAALLESEARYARAVRGTSDGLWDWNVLTNEDYLSPRWKELLGYTDDELTDHYDTFFSRVHPDDKSRVQAAINDHLEKNVPYDIEHRLRTKSCDYRWFSDRGMAERDEQGKAVLMSGSITDITERKQAEKEREKLIKDLQKALEEIKTLRGIIPICASCKKIRDDQGYWNQIEAYITKHSKAEFSHSICQECAKKLYPDLVDENGNFPST